MKTKYFEKQLKLWEIIFKLQVVQFAKILFQINEPEVESNVSTVKNLNALWKTLKSEIFNFGR
jgi:hypothetical protein